MCVSDLIALKQTQQLIVSKWNRQQLFRRRLQNQDGFLLKINFIQKNFWRNLSEPN